MHFTPYDRETSVARPVGAVVDFVAHVPNLPRWTRFFTAVGEQVERRYRVSTQLGPASSWAEVLEIDGGREVHVCTRFADREERARVEVLGAPGGSNVRFHARLPADWSRERTGALLSQIEAELSMLKEILEIELS